MSAKAEVLCANNPEVFDLEAAENSFVFVKRKISSVLFVYSKMSSLDSLRVSVLVRFRNKNHLPSKENIWIMEHC